MYNAEELRFLRDALAKCRVNVSLHNFDDAVSSVIGEEFLMLAGVPRVKELRISDVVGVLKPRTLYKRANKFFLCFSYLTLDIGGASRILLVGPYLPSPLSPSDILGMAEKNGVAPENVRLVTEFYSGIPVVQGDDRIFIFLHTFCERLWDTPRFDIVDLAERGGARVFSPQSVSGAENDFDPVLVGMRLIERRYGFENEIMDAVTNGQLQKESQLLSAVSGEHFERRSSDPVRNSKNYAIIMNTLLRKAAEKGGVHPLYLDSTSSSFAYKIEALSSHSDAVGLMIEMFRTYCRLVASHSTQGLSPTVRRAVLMIDSDLSANLTLASLASAQNVSRGYLSTSFKRETGKTLSEYVREKRIVRAKELLLSTGLQVQSVAQQCGFDDVQYFTRQFKRETGMTPVEYRDTNISR